jgi:hypothetical protein
MVEKALLEALACHFKNRTAFTKTVSKFVTEIYLAAPPEKLN